MDSQHLGGEEGETNKALNSIAVAVFLLIMAYLRNGNSFVFPSDNIANQPPTIHRAGKSRQ